MAATTANGETTESGSFIKVVKNTYDPLKARGDTIIDNFDLRFVVDSAYSFPGGGLIIKFSNGSTAYRADNQSCDQVGVVGKSTDSSGNFVLAFWDDDDGISPWGPQQPPISLQEEIIGGFQIIEGPTVLLAGDTIDQSDTPITATTVGETITYRVKAQNPGPSDTTGVTVTVTLDDFVSFVQSSQNPPAATIFDAGPPATIEWSVGSLAAGAEATLEADLDVLFDAGSQTISNSAEVTGSDAPYKVGLIDQSDVTVAPSIDLSGEMLNQSGAGIATVQAGELFVYRINVSNSSQIDGSGVEITVTLPQNLLFQQAESTPPAATVPDAGPPETVTWTVGGLNAGADATLDIDVIASFSASGETLTGTAAVTAPAQGDEVATQILVDRAINITSRSLDDTGANISVATTGDTVRYEVVVRNDSQADATGLEITATLSENLVFQQLTPTPPTTATFNSGPPGTIAWDIGNLAPGAEVTLAVDSDVPFAASGQPISNRAQITGSDAPLEIGDTTVSDITIEEAIDLIVTTLDASGAEITSADIGDTINFQVIVSNSGGADATSLEIITTLADSLTFIEALAQADTTFDAGPPATVTWSLDTLASGTDATLNIELEVEFGAGGLLISNGAEITNSDAVLTIGLNGAAEITISVDGTNLLKGGSGACFIATAAYGSYLEPEVMILQQFRDDFLLTNEPGRAFVAWYYRNSPGAAALIADHETARTIFRIMLTPIVYLLKYPLAALLSMLLIIFIIGWTRKSARLTR